ncbi:MAG: sigma-70 family RNA polymerase sigma factor, partial [Planctomycetota bacterium]
FSDGELLDAWTNDQLAEAFATLVNRYGAMVLSVCRRKCRSNSDADDAYQSTFLLLAKSGGKIRRPECLAGWLHRVAQRASVATLARRESDALTENSSTEIEDPLKHITKQHDAIVLDEELASLPEKYRAPIVMHVLDDIPLQVIAERLQSTLGSVRGRLQRGKKLLAVRLRKRGLVPVLAVCAANASIVSPADAASASAGLLSQIDQGIVPDPPIPDSLLQPLLNSGNRMMKPWKTAVAIAIAGTIGVSAILPGFGKTPGQPIERLMASNGRENNDDPVLIAQKTTELGTIELPGGDEASEVVTEQPVGGKPPAGKESNDEPSVVATQYQPNVPEGPLAQSLAAKMDQNVAIAFSDSLGQLPEILQTQIEAPVFLSERTLAYAELRADKQLKFTSQDAPLRSSLRKMLSPLGLKATIETEGLVIQPDHYQLVHKGIGLSRWINVDDDFMQAEKAKLATPISVNAVETPLSDFVDSLSAQLNMKFLIDAKSLEEVGLTPDTPISISLDEVAADDLLINALDPLDLSVLVRGGVFQVATWEACEETRLSRVYYLEGLSVGGDFDSIFNLIETSIHPDTWEALGGNSTLTPVTSGRPAVIVATTYEVHRQIESLIHTLRENSFELDAISSPIAQPRPQASGMMPTQGMGGFGGMPGPAATGGGMF